jgi:hypothetical protein
MSAIRVICLALAGALTVTAQAPSGNSKAVDDKIAAAEALLAELNAEKEEIVGKRGVQIRSEKGHVVIEAGEKGATLGFKVGKDTLLLDKIPEQMRGYSDATTAVLETGFTMGAQQASVAETCSKFLEKLDQNVDKSITKLEEDLGKIDKATDAKLVVLTSNVDGKLEDFGTEQEKVLNTLTEKLEASVKAATEAAADAKAKAEGFKACDYTKQYFDKQADACKNVKACSDGEEYSEKPMFADWTCAAKKTDCLPMAELCRAHKGKTGRFPVCETGSYVFCEMDTDGGKWSLVANIHPADGNSVGYRNEDFWVNAGEYGGISTCLDADYKSEFAHNFKGKEILGTSRDYGSNKIKGWRAWGYEGKTWNSMFQPGIRRDQNWYRDFGRTWTASCKTTNPKRGSNKDTDAWDDIMRQGACLRSDVHPSRSGWGDVIRLTTTDHSRHDNKMSGFASCIDCGYPWQGAHGNAGDTYRPFMGIDRAMCNQRECHYHVISRSMGLDGSMNENQDCLGNYCNNGHYGHGIRNEGGRRTETSGSDRRGFRKGWTSQFYIR